MKLCVIGNSHVAMLAAARMPGLDLTVFAKPSLDWGEARLDGTVLRAVDPVLVERLEMIGTPPELDLSGFDAVAIVALMPSVFAATRLSQSHAISHWPSGKRRRARVLQRTGQTPGRPLLSQSALRATLRSLTEASLGFALARDLRAACKVPILVLPQPHPSAEMLEIEDKYPIFRRIVKDGDGAALVQDLEAAQRAAFATLADVTLVTQPPMTVRHGCFTDPTLMRGAVRLLPGSRQPKGDVLHGNGGLGRHFLQGSLEFL